MARAIELNLNSPEMFAGDTGSGSDEKRERPDFDQIGSENLKWAGEKVKDFGKSLWGGLKRLGKRVASTPARAEYAMNVTMPDMAAKASAAVNEGGMQLHEGAMRAKDSVVESFQNGVINSGEFVEKKYEAVSTFAVDSYKGLESRAGAAYEKMSSRVEAANQRRKESRYKAAVLKMQEARLEMLAAAAEAGIKF